MAEKKTFKAVTEEDAKKALMEAKDLRVKEGKELDDKRAKQIKDVTVTKTDAK